MPAFLFPSAKEHETGNSGFDAWILSGEGEVKEHLRLVAATVSRSGNSLWKCLGIILETWLDRPHAAHLCGWVSKSEVWNDVTVRLALEQGKSHHLREPQNFCRAAAKPLLPVPCAPGPMTQKFVIAKWGSYHARYKMHINWGGFSMACSLHREMVAWSARLGV